VIRAAATAALLLILAGCTTPPPDVSGVLTEADAPAGTTWIPTGTVLTAGDDLETVEEYWADAGGSPEECFPLYLAAYGIRVADAGSADRTVEVGYFSPTDGGTGSIMVNARDFPDEAGATEYIQDVLESANACPGYTVGGLAVAPEGFAVARFEGGHGITGDGGSGDVATRFAVVRSGRTVIVIDAFLPQPTVLDLGVVDEIARLVLTRLGE